MKPQKPAFTLIEILIVVAIIVVLLAMVTQMIGAASDSQNKKRALADMAVISNALEEFKSVSPDYPRLSTVKDEYENSKILYKCLTGKRYMKVDSNGMISFKNAKRKSYINSSLMKISNPNGDENVDPDSDDAIFIDPWGNPYVYIYNTSKSAGKVGRWESTTYILLSKGVDGESFVTHSMEEEGYIGDISAYKNRNGNEDNIINGID